MGDCAKMERTAMPAAAGNRPQEDERRKERYSPACTKAPQLAKLVDRNAKERVTPDITFRIPRIRHKEDVAAVVAVLKDSQDDETVRNEAANLLRRSDYRRLTDDLVAVLGDPEEGPHFRAFCIQHLWSNLPKAGAEEREKIGATLHQALGDRHVSVRREALLALHRMKDEKAKQRAVETLNDPAADDTRDLAQVRQFKVDSASMS